VKNHPHFFTSQFLHLQLSEYDIECVRKAKEYIDANISIHISIDLLAQKSGIGATKLKAGFKWHYGYSPFLYLRNQRMIKAGELLRNSYKTTKQIAKATGFKHSNNFITAFKVHYRVTPRQYRRLHSSD